ncbi:MAG: TIGR04211 family SH3 domain-containing protein [Gammaproteobacteria bacterium]
MHPVKNFLLLFMLLYSFYGNAEEHTVYVTDDLELTLRGAENNRSKILKMLRSGTPLTLIEERDTGYSLVRTTNGIEGYLLTRFTKSKPPVRWYLEQANKKIEQLQKDNESFKNELAGLKGDKTQNISSNHQLTLERDQLQKELEEIKSTAANAIDLKNQRDQLQERVVTVERELQQIKRKNQALQDNTNQDWFLYGGILSLIGVLMGFILPKLGWRRKSSGWDTF